MSLETTATVTLGGKEYVAKAVPIGKLTKLAKNLSGVIDALAKSEAQQVDQAIEVLVGNLGAGLNTFFRTFIPTLPDGIFDDEENGPTLPEIVEAVKVIAKLNRLDTLGNVLRPLSQTLQGTVSRLSN